MNISTLDQLFDRLFPLNRSLTGSGYRQSMDILAEYIPLTYLDVKSGENVFDWVVPKEWNVEKAYIINPEGRVIVDFDNNNLHVLNYSIPVNQKVSLEELKKHLFTIEELPDAVPYVTSYYKENWGFCISYNQYKTLIEGEYTVVIDSSLTDGFIRIGETVLRGETDREILLSSYLCHPSMANNELSGPLVLVYLYNKLKEVQNRKFTYRFVINPETIGSIAYLQMKYMELKNKIVGGMVLTCLGGPSQTLSYKLSKHADSIIDKFFLEKQKFGGIDIRKFTPLGGSDERQYNSPGINIPIGQIGRTLYGEHKEYHNSLDDKKFMSLAQLELSCSEVFKYLLEIESLKFYHNMLPHGEPQLGKRDLYPSINSNQTREASSNDLLMDGKRMHRTVMFLVNFCDGKHSTNDITAILNEDVAYVNSVAEILTEKNILERI